MTTTTARSIVRAIITRSYRRYTPTNGRAPTLATGTPGESASPSRPTPCACSGGSSAAAAAASCAGGVSRQSAWSRTSNRGDQVPGQEELDLEYRPVTLWSP
ncbi:hypothetical protein [Kitasatospora sp. NPDC098663]|uniref:hypothetical protein n=1 Tax=Kitasatospora sp. NPDC098663 TaxID=3364096 RepID=UPI003807F0BC